MEQESEPAVIEVPPATLPYFKAPPRTKPQNPVIIDKNAGIPKWLLDPIKIPSNLKDSRYALPLDDPSISLSERVKNICKSQNIEHLFPVQTAVIRTLLDYSPADHADKARTKFSRFSFNGRHPGDLLVSAPTGSGKTLAYVIPIVEAMANRSIPHLQALIILPTLDLVNQVKSVFNIFVEGTDLKVIAVAGGGRADASGSNSGFAAEQQQILGISSVTAAEEFDECFGGIPASKKRRTVGCDILITTPGRLVDHLTFTTGFTVQHLRWLIIDEADRLLNQSFNDCLQKTLNSCMAVDFDQESMFSVRDLSAYPLKTKHALIKKMYQGMEFDPREDWPSDPLIGNLLGPPVHLQKILFSATLTRNPGKIASLHLIKPRLIATVNVQDNEEENESLDQMDVQKYILPSTLTQYYWVCKDIAHKPLYLLRLLSDFSLVSTLCFTKSIENAERLYEVISLFLQEYWPEKNFKVAHYSSSLSAYARSDILKQFREGQLNILICTDALARGVDIKELQDDSTKEGSKTAIINYDIPVQIKTYVHRAGRTARAGREGMVFNILGSHECRHWKESMRKHLMWEGVKGMKIKEDEEYTAMIELYKKVLNQVREKLGMHTATN